MEHLTIDEIARFVSFTELNEVDIKLASRVNSHILRCTECREKVRTSLGDYGEKPINKAYESRLLTDSEEEDMCVLGVGRDV